MNRILYAALSFLASSAFGQTLVVDKSKIRFVGTSCKNLSADDVEIEDFRLLIKLKNMGVASSEAASKGCLIKIPYAGGKAKSSLTLDGVYELSGSDQLTATLRWDTQGQLTSAKILSVSESPKGKLSWQDTLEVADEVDSERTLRISLFYSIKSSPDAEETGRLEESKFGFSSLSLSNVKAKEKEKEKAAK